MRFYFSSELNSNEPHPLLEEYTELPTLFVLYETRMSDLLAFESYTLNLFIKFK